ncbi:MAG: hypothetical protein AAF216_12910 [Pseudomonadota bacterium]
MWLEKGAAIAAGLAIAGCGDSSDLPDHTTNREPILPPAATPVRFEDDKTYRQDADFASGGSGLQVLSPDFAVVDMAVRTQDAFQIEADGAVLDFAASTEGRLVLEERFTLVAETGLDHPRLEAMAAPGFAVRTFRLADADHERMLEVRRKLAEMRSETPGRNELSLGAGIYGCLAVGHDAPDDLNLLVALRITPDGDFHPIAQEEAMKTAGTPLADVFWTPCEENLAN